MLFLKTIFFLILIFVRTQPHRQNVSNPYSLKSTIVPQQVTEARGSQIPIDSSSLYLRKEEPISYRIPTTRLRAPHHKFPSHRPATLNGQPTSLRNG